MNALTSLGLLRVQRYNNYLKLPNKIAVLFVERTHWGRFPVSSLLLEWTEAHAARGRDGRQEGRECGYYHLHRHLNNLLLHDY